MEGSEFIILIEEKTLTEKYFIFEEKTWELQKKRRGKNNFPKQYSYTYCNKEREVQFEYGLRSVKFNWAVICAISWDY